jgi:hypothetical protein
MRTEIQMPKSTKQKIKDENDLGIEIIPTNNPMISRINIKR